MEDFITIASLVNGWLVTGGGVLGVVTTVLGVFLKKAKKTEAQLTKVIDKSEPKNEIFKDLAQKEGLELAAKVLRKIL